MLYHLISLIWRWICKKMLLYLPAYYIWMLWLFWFSQIWCKKKKKLLKERCWNTAWFKFQKMSLKTFMFLCVYVTQKIKCIYFLLLVNDKGKIDDWIIELNLMVHSTIISKKNINWQVLVYQESVFNNKNKYTWRKRVSDIAYAIVSCKQ